MTAREKFHIGQPVTLTAEAIQRKISRHVEHGVVVGFGDRSTLVWIQREGRKSRESYHMDFWEPDARRDTV
jgi:hypothetical protein